MSAEESQLLRFAATLGFTLVIDRSVENAFCLYRGDSRVYQSEATPACFAWLHGVNHERNQINAKG